MSYFKARERNKNVVFAKPMSWIEYFKKAGALTEEAVINNRGEGYYVIGDNREQWMSVSQFLDKYEFANQDEVLEPLISEVAARNKSLVELTEYLDKKESIEK